MESLHFYIPSVFGNINDNHKKVSESLPVKGYRKNIQVWKILRKIYFVLIIGDLKSLRTKRKLRKVFSLKGTFKCSSTLEHLKKFIESPAKSLIWPHFFNKKTICLKMASERYFMYRRSFYSQEDLLSR